MKNHILADVWHPVYEGEEDSGTPATAEDETPTPNSENEAQPIPSKKSFTQDEVNQILAKEKRKEQERTKKALSELEAIRSRAKLTAQERDELDGRIEQMRNELLTKEELAKKERDRLRKDHEQTVKSLSEERDSWRTRYESSTITRAITDAAAANNAYAPSQVVAILGSGTRMVEVLDSDGNPTGEFEPRVRFHDTDKEGKPVTLELKPAEAVKRMKEMDQYLNLFKVEGASGTGLQNHARGRKQDIRELAKDPVAYREAKKKGLI